MNDNIIADLKQFITAAISQQTSEIRDEIVEVREDIKKLDTKVDDLSTSVADALYTSNEEADKTLKDHENRIRTLEQRTI